MEVLEGFFMAMKLGLIEARRFLQDHGFGRWHQAQFLSETRDGSVKGKIEIQLGKAN